MQALLFIPTQALWQFRRAGSQASAVVDSNGNGVDNGVDSDNDNDVCDGDNNK